MNKKRTITQNNRMIKDLIKKIRQAFTSKTDIDGSYTGNSTMGNEVEQDVDDL